MIVDGGVRIYKIVRSNSNNEWLNPKDLKINSTCILTITDPELGGNKPNATPGES